MKVGLKRRNAARNFEPRFDSNLQPLNKEATGAVHCSVATGSADWPPVGLPHSARSGKSALPVATRKRNGVPVTCDWLESNRDETSQKRLATRWMTSSLTDTKCFHKGK
jgi:hypothetical protein